MRINGHTVPLKYIISVVIGLFTLIGGAFTIDATYVRAADARADHNELYIETQESMTEIQMQQSEQALMDMAMRHTLGIIFPTDEARKAQLERSLKRYLERKDELADKKAALKGGS